MQTLKDIRSTLDLQSFFWNWFYMTVGAALFIISIDVFLAPSNISPGGVAGIAIIINHFTGLPIGSMMLLLNIPMFFVGFRYLGRYRFLLSTAYVVLVYNLGVDFFRAWLPPLTDDLLLNAIYSAIVGGIGTGLVYRGRATVAGTGVLSRVIQLKTGIPLSQLYLYIDGVVILAAALIFGWEIGLYSLITLFIWGVVADYVLEGPSVIRTAFIITDAPKEVAQAVLDRLGLGVTGWTGEGMFTHAPHTILFCTLNRPDVNALKSTVVQVDPRAFIVVGQGHNATGGTLRAMADANKLRNEAIGLKVESPAVNQPG
jgi:uncharacterized membrane-anchored protein YitT (DUF2179 family)